MRDVSNKTLMVLMVVALAVTVVGTMVGISKLGALGSRYAMITGANTVTGTGDINIQGTAAIDIVDGFVNFTTGYVDPAYEYAIIPTDGGSIHNWKAPDGSAVSPFSDNHTIENNGTVRASVSVALTSTDYQDPANNAEDFFCSGGCQSNFAAIYVKAQEIGNSCVGTPATSFTELANNSHKNTVTLCDDLLPTNGQDRLAVFFNLTVPGDADSGKHTMTLTYTAQQA